MPRLRAHYQRIPSKSPKFPVTVTQKVSPSVLKTALELADGDCRKVKVINYSKVEVETE